ncbi:MAG: Coenzyme F420 hydrogenase/dehydrogenase, beta subunit C-terminal domain [Promethearchaeota archaeon]
MDEMGTFSKETMAGVVHAVQDFRIRCLVDAKDEIVATGRYSGEEVDRMVLTLFDEELRKFRLYRAIRERGAVDLQELAAESYPGDSRPAGVYETSRLAYLLASEGLVEVSEGEGAKLVVACKVDDPAGVKSVYVPVTEVSKPFCAGCGLCQGICPVDCINVENGVLSIDEARCIHCGLCFSVCPRSFLPKRVVNWTVRPDSDLPDDLPIGPVLAAYSGRATDDAIREVAQDGGVVTALLTYAFNEGIVDAALGARMSETPWLPEPFLMTSPEEVRLAAGTKYATNPTLQVVPDLSSYENVAVVGTPCMMQALRKVEAYPFGNPFLEKVKLKLGIFCMESFSYASILEIARTLDVSIDEVKKMDINKGKFFIYTRSGEVRETAIKEVTHLARHECHYCYDLTSENGDISVGSIGSPAGWSTVIVRNQKGKDLLGGAVEAGLVEIKPMDEVKPGMDLVRKIAGFKRKGYGRAKEKAAVEGKRSPGYM